ncbi:MAG TPA: SDR family oxidoreductase [Bryobacteraceae bacterium]
MILKGRTALITGGTRGVGRAIAERLVREGAAVAICGRSAATVQSAVGSISSTGGKVCGTEADISSLESVQRLFDFVDRQLGGLDILVNNAGIAILRHTADLKSEQWQQTLATNLSGVFYCCQEAIVRFRKRGGGFIVNIGSLLGKTGVTGGAAYCASKFGLNGLSEAMMLDCRQENIGVCTILPGSIDTELFGASAGSEWKIHPGDIAQMVTAILEMQGRTLVSRVEMRPLRPAK